jgi:hypothetical protein
MTAEQTVTLPIHFLFSVEVGRLDTEGPELCQKRTAQDRKQGVIEWLTKG